MSHEKLLAVAGKVRLHLQTRFDDVHEMWMSATFGHSPISAVVGYRVADHVRKEGPAIVLAQVWADGGFDIYVSASASTLVTETLDGVVAAVRRDGHAPRGSDEAPAGSYVILGPPQ